MFSGNDVFSNLEKSFGKRVLIKSVVTAYFSWIGLVIMVRAFEKGGLSGYGMVGTLMALFGGLFWKFDDRLGKQWQILVQAFYGNELTEQQTIHLAMDTVRLNMHRNACFKNFVNNQVFEASRRIMSNYSECCTIKPEFAEEYPKNDDCYGGNPKQFSPINLSKYVLSNLDSEKKKGFVMYTEEVIDLFNCAIDIDRVYKNKYTVNGFKRMERRTLSN
jgi:hypothetical protein